MIVGVEEGLLPVLLPVITPASTNPANEVARALTGRDYISWSAISTFRSCPLKYWFRYVARLPESLRHGLPENPVVLGDEQSHRGRRTERAGSSVSSSSSFSSPSSSRFERSTPSSDTMTS